MKVGLISDVHGNLIALEEVLSCLNQCEVIYCAGDVVGYYPFPNEVIEIFRENEIRSVMGNHDYAVVTGDFFGFNIFATVAGQWTRKNLKEENMEWLMNLPLKIETDWFNVYHGMPSEDLRVLDEYIYPNDPRIKLSLEELKKNVIVGHTHVQFVIWHKGYFFANPGSVGQPRDGNSDSAYAIYDTEKNRIELKRVKYKIQEVYDAVIKAGLPEFLGERLFLGY
ncbi:MAG: metallophosphoesterase [Archaeoglobales archaeon]|nr:MAG: metallophosphoesterase [Archaeoglobales archaeon]